jgi:hypothetical protein
MVILAAFTHRKIAPASLWPVEELVALVWSSSECTVLSCYDDTPRESTMTVRGGISCSYFHDAVVRAADSASRNQDWNRDILRSFRDDLVEGRLDGWQDECDMHPDIQLSSETS